VIAGVLPLVLSRLDTLALREAEKANTPGLAPQTRRVQQVVEDEFNAWAAKASQSSPTAKRAAIESRQQRKLRELEQHYTTIAAKTGLQPRSARRDGRPTGAQYPAVQRQ